MDKLIAEIRKTKDYENLKERLGKKLGTLIYQLVDEADKTNVSRSLRDIYSGDLNSIKMSDLLTKKEIKIRVKKIESLGMYCPLVLDGLKKNLSVKELNELWQIERSIIKGAINDIELCL